MFERSEFSSLQRLIAIFKGKIYMGIVSLVRFFAIKEMNRRLIMDLALNIIKGIFLPFILFLSISQFLPVHFSLLAQRKTNQKETAVASLFFLCSLLLFPHNA